MRYLFFIIVFGLFITSSFAQDDIVTDRPDQTESAISVGKGRFQLETGFLYQYNKENLLETEEYAYNSSLLRYGLFDGFELRFGFEYMQVKYQNKDVDYEESFKGWSPMSIGAKTEISKQNGWIPEMAILTTFILNTAGDQVFGQEYTGFDIRLAAAHELSDFISLGYNFGAEWDGGSPGPTYFYSIAAGMGLTGKIGMFLESYGYLPEFAMPDHRFDGGFTYLLMDNLQLDLSGGLGLSEISPDYFISIGLSWKY